jgi:hypothetical protein
MKNAKGPDICEEIENISSTEDNKVKDSEVGKSGQVYRAERLI